VNELATMADKVIHGNEEPIFNVLGVLIRFLVPPTQSGDEIAMMHSVIGPGTVIPLHSHIDPELFFVLEGSIEVYRAGEGFDGWAVAEAGDSFLISSGIRHSLRNISASAATAIAVSRGSLYDFFRELAQPFDPAPPSQPPTPEEMVRVLGLAKQYGYWMGSPEENAAIGISLA
jgi:quercetin dioxygenase-like cupin family protein